MDWIERLNAAIAYIEENLTGEIRYERLGQIACCDFYHYQRMFGYMAGMPLSEYIRRRRMSLAAADLQAGEQKIIDVAAKYGYESPTAFNRAFQSVHGFAPSQTCEAGRIIKSFEPISFQITIKGAVTMDYRIEKRDAFRVLGISTPMSSKIEENFANIPGLWDRASQDGTIDRLCGMMNASPMGVLGVCACNGDPKDWRYYIGVSTTAKADDLEECTIPAFTWAVFPGSGAGSSIQQLEQRIVEWLPTSGYEYANGPDVEVYLNADPVNMQYEVWIPVVKK